MNAQLIFLPVLLQNAHTLMHTGTNQVPLRRCLFISGCVVLILMTALAAWVLVIG